MDIIQSILGQSRNNRNLQLKFIQNNFFPVVFIKAQI